MKNFVRFESRKYKICFGLRETVEKEEAAFCTIRARRYTLCLYIYIYVSVDDRDIYTRLYENSIRYGNVGLVW